MKHYPPLSFRGLLLFAGAAALLLCGLIGFLHRESLHTFSDYVLIAGLSFGLMTWTVICLRLQKKIQALSLVVRGFAFAFSLVALAFLGAYLRRHVTGELSSELAHGPFSLVLLIPLLPAFLGQPLSKEEEEHGASARH